jgi:hypothetical protein
MWMRGQVAVLASCAGLLGACGGGGEADENAAMGGGQAPPEQSSEASGPQAPNPEQAEAIGQTVRDFAALMDSNSILDVPVERRQEACKLLTPEVQAAWVQLSEGEAGDCPTAIDPLGADGLAAYPLLVDEDGTDILDSGNDAYREALDDVDINIVLDGPSTALAILHGTAKAFELTSADGRWLISRPAMVPVAEETVPLVAYGNAMRQCVMENAEAVGFPGQFDSDTTLNEEFPADLAAPVTPNTFSWKTQETVDGGGNSVVVDSFGAETTAANLFAFFENELAEFQESAEFFSNESPLFSEGDVTQSVGRSLVIIRRTQNPVEGGEAIVRVLEGCAQEATEAAMQPPMVDTSATP